VQDRPTYSELLEAVQHFIEADVMPALDGPRKFHARVAANVLAIVRRELEVEDRQLRDEWQRLDALLGDTGAIPTERDVLRRQLLERSEALCARIRNGEADTGPWRDAVLLHVRQTVVDKLTVANPKYLVADAAGVVSATAHTR